jgi:hypothetical protein
VPQRPSFNGGPQRVETASEETAKTTKTAHLSKCNQGSVRRLGVLIAFNKRIRGLLGAESFRAAWSDALFFLGSFRSFSG